MSNSNNSTSWFVFVGGFVAVFVSVALNHSFWWAVLHWWFGWAYILYVLICRSHEIFPAINAMFT